MYMRVPEPDDVMSMYWTGWTIISTKDQNSDSMSEDHFKNESRIVTISPLIIARETLNIFNPAWQNPK